MENDTRRLLLNSPSGVKLATVELLNVFSSVEKLISSGLDETGNRKTISIQRRACLISEKKYCVQLVWESKYKNTLESSFLLLRLWRGSPSKKTASLIRFKKPKLIIEKKFEFDLNEIGDRKWKECDTSKSVTSKTLAHMSIETLNDAGSGRVSE